MTLPPVERLIERFALEPHPEGGFYRETYRSAHSTAIYYLLPQGTRSMLHRLKSDELFHFYLGGPLRVVKLPPVGPAETVLMGPDLEGGACLQHVIKAGTWFGAYPEPESPYCLIGCTVSPAFRFEEFELGQREALLRAFPDAAAHIERLLG